MPAILDLYMNQFLVFVLILTRISGLVMTAPIFGSSSTPVRIRALLAVGLSLLIAPLHWGIEIDYPGNLLVLGVMVIREGILGLALGLSVLILFAGFQLTGQIIGQMSGMSLADVFDPSFDASVPLFSQLLNQVTMAVFLIIGGHRQVMDAMLDTFRWMPPGDASSSSSSIVEALVETTTQSFVIGIRAAAPMMVALLMSVLIMGLISRTLPQLNVMAIGFTLNSVVMMLALSVSMSAIVWIFQEEVGRALEAVKEAFTMVETLGV